METTEQIIQRLVCLKASDAPRKLVAIAGTPGSGKTTLAHALTDNIANCACLSMDGFHLDNPILDAMNLSNRKGSPETFDIEGFRSLVRRLKKPNDVYIPVFDRSSEKTINCASLIPATTEIIVLEGNYLTWQCERKSSSINSTSLSMPESFLKFPILRDTGDRRLSYF